MALSALDEHYGITDRVIAGVDDIATDIETKIQGAKQQLYRDVSQIAGSAFDYAIDSAKIILISAAKHTIEKFLSGKPRL